MTGDLIRPSEAGQAVRIIGYGWKVRQYHVGLFGVVVRVLPSGNLRVRFDRPPAANPKPEITVDPACAAVVVDGKYVRA